MRYLSVCSGIEAATAAWHPLGWTPVGFAEIEKFPSAVLAHHYPSVPNLGDMSKFQEWPDDLAPNLLVGGTPCQSFSVAGLRKGLDDPRGNLMLTFGAIAAKYRPEWLVWENVPGVLSSNGGRDFGTFLGMLAELGYGFAYRVLDAQYFGVAQRRRRVFVVANARDWRRAAAVLFDAESLRGNPAPRRESGKVAPTIPSRSTGGGGLGTDFDLDGGLIREWPADVACTLNAAFGDKQGLEDQHALNGASLFVPDIVGTLTARSVTSLGAPEVDGGMYIPTTATAITASMGCGALGHNKDENVIAHTLRGEGFDEAYSIRTANTSSNGLGVQHEVTHTLDQAQGLAVAHTLRGEGFDASEDGTGRGTPLVPVAMRESGQGFWMQDEVAGTLRAEGENRPSRPSTVLGVPLAFSCKDHGADAGEVAPTLRSMNHDGSHANGGGQVAVAFAIQAGALRQNPNSGPDGVGVQADHAYTLEARAEVQAVAFNWQGGGTQTSLGYDPESGITGSLHVGQTPAVAFAQNQRDEVRTMEVAGALAAEPGAKQQTYLHSGMAVRRLTPRECERLQGFRDDFTAIPWRGKPADKCPDGPRYKALGNSMAVPVMRWIGERIAQVSAIEAKREAA